MCLTTTISRSKCVGYEAPYIHYIHCATVYEMAHVFPVNSETEKVSAYSVTPHKREHVCTLISRCY